MIPELKGGHILSFAKIFTGVISLSSSDVGCPSFFSEDEIDGKWFGQPNKNFFLHYEYIKLTVDFASYIADNQQASLIRCK